MSNKVNAAIDCIIFGFDHKEEELKLLIIKRHFEPGKGNWSLMSGFLNNYENFDESADRILKELTGISDIYLEQMHAYSGKMQDPDDRTVVVAYFALINTEKYTLEDSKYAAKWVSLKEKPTLIFDHDKMVEKAIEKLQIRSVLRPIGFNLLPEKFTMRQLIRLYECIWNRELDKANFTKKINALDLLEKLDEKDMTSSKKGSYLYRFDPKKFKTKSNPSHPLLFKHFNF